MSKIVDESFRNVGQQPGLNIWRIENFNLNKLKPKQYGYFYSGDSYLILNTIGEKNRPTSWDIHFWLGAESTVDEYATAAYKAVELDDFLGGRPVQYRDVQYHESKLFLSYFESGVTYLSGGIKSALTQTGDIKEEPRLFMVKGKRDIRMVQVPLLFSSLNKSDVFILDDNKRLFQWNTPGSNRLERLKATVFAKKIRDDEHGGRPEIIDFDINEYFLRVLSIADPNGKKTQIKEQSDVQDKEFESNFNKADVKLYRVTDKGASNASIKLEAQGQLKKSLLDSNDCFIVDLATKGIFSWIGKKCTKKEKEAAINGVKNLIQQNNYPNYIPIINVIEDGETTDPYSQTGIKNEYLKFFTELH